MEKPQHIHLLLTWFQKTGEALMGEELISSFPAKKAHEILGIKDARDHFICGEYPLDKEKTVIFQEYVTHTFDLAKYDYFIGGIAEENINHIEKIRNGVDGVFSRKPELSQDFCLSAEFKPAPKVLKAFPNAVRVKPKTSII